MVALSGFEGDHCEINIDDCVNNACRKGSTCVDQVSSYFCVCPDGWKGIFPIGELSVDNVIATFFKTSGNHCTDDIDECSDGTMRCLNGGTCINTEGKYDTYSKLICYPSQKTCDLYLQ